MPKIQKSEKFLIAIAMLGTVCLTGCVTSGGTSAQNYGNQIAMQDSQLCGPIPNDRAHVLKKIRCERDLLVPAFAAHSPKDLDDVKVYFSRVEIAGLNYAKGRISKDDFDVLLNNLKAELDRQLNINNQLAAVQNQARDAKAIQELDTASRLLGPQQAPGSSYPSHTDCTFFSSTVNCRNY